MAKQQDSANSQESEIFNKGLIKDYDDIFYPEGTWSHARNATNNTIGGDVGIIGNEPANKLCTNAPYTIIGQIKISSERWAVYSTNNVDSEIGLFLEDSCTYHTIVNDPCLNFKTTNLIIGVSKENFDCSYQLYWDDGVNPTRTLNVGDIRLGSFDQPWPGVPYVCEDVNPDPDCRDCEPAKPYTLDCEKIRLAKLVTVPCVKISEGTNGGTLQNGSYYAVVAYTINQQKVTDYFNPSQIQPIFSHQNLSGSLEVTITNLDESKFEEFELVIVRTINQQTSAKRIGYYNTNPVVNVSIDYINESLPSVPIETIPLRRPAYESSDAIFQNGPYMIRTGPKTKFDFNYQPLANQIGTEWVMKEYDYRYYRNGGNEVGYMRDEQYAFWIRFVYNTGERSSSYHIPGRAKINGLELVQSNGEWVDITASTYGLPTFDNVELRRSLANGTAYEEPKVWEAYNTAFVDPQSAGLLTQPGDPVINGRIIGYGGMGYWESSERYPNNKPEVWNATYTDPDTGVNIGSTTNTVYDLCGKPMRHHKMPADILNYVSGGDGTDSYSRIRTSASGSPEAIRVLGVRFKNIKCPVDNQGVPIPGIVGYEILRSSREGNKTIVAKGMLNNMRQYTNDEGRQVLYQNYPYNFRGADRSLTSQKWNDTFGIGNAYTNNNGNGWNNPSRSLTGYSKTNLTFHSPDTTFRKNFISASELRIYGQIGGYNNIRGNFEDVKGHPREKLPTNLALFLAIAVGIGIAGKSIQGKQTRVIKGPVSFNPGFLVGGTLLGGYATGQINSKTDSYGFTGSGAAESTYQEAFNTIAGIFGEAISGVNPALTTYINAVEGIEGIWSGLAEQTILGSLASGKPAGGFGSARDLYKESSDADYTPPTLKLLSGGLTYANYIMEGTSSAFDLLIKIGKFRDYVLRYVSHGNFHKHELGNAKKSIGNTRRFIQDAVYLDNQLQNIGQISINNIYRGKTVALQLSNNVEDPIDSATGAPFPDNSTQTLGTAFGSGLISGDVSSIPSILANYTDSFRTSSVSYYGALKIPIRNQYGQLESVRQVPTGCVYSFEKPTTINTDTSIPIIRETPDIYGGDTYIGRYTEKNTFFYFYDWLMNQPDGTEFDYRLRTMVSNPRFWANFTGFDMTEFINGAIDSIAGGDGGNAAWQNILSSLSRNIYNLDLDDYTDVNTLLNTNNSPNSGYIGSLKDKLRITKQIGWMYLFQSGVRDFFVESEINVDLRDWGENPSERHYDPYEYNSLQELFAPDIIKSGNYYKYDFSLSCSRVFNNFISWGNTQPRYYNPQVAETCYTYYPNRVIYSLPQQDEAVKDYWQVFLPNNYKDFTSKVTAIKPISKNGALMLFDTQGPAQFLGVDTLQTDTGTKITLGDGGLFSQPLQYLTNADAEFQHGSCQNRLSITNTPAGVYFMSRAQGKIFAVTGKGLEEISGAGMRWWFNRYLPYQLTIDFPDYILIDNPVAGIGCQSVFDNSNMILYFSKRDFRKRRDITDNIVYAPGKGYNTFLVNDTIEVQLGDPAYFEDCSWTISYDPKNQMWISFHDWHPELAISSKNYFLTTKTNAAGEGCIWRHNDRTDLYANYYGIDYPFEIEYIAATGQTVNTVKSLEYDLECYTYDVDGIDTYHVLDFNFDHAVVHNTEQVSGVLNLNLTPKGNPIAALQYPIINPTSIDILYSKEEQKYRMNQFWDITRDRGEFTFPNVQQPIWSTELNGYKRQLNINNLDYQKSAFERKKFRHYTTHVLLYRNISGPIKMLFKITNVKNQYSPR